MRSEAPIAPPYQIGTSDRIKIILLVLLAVGVGLRLWIKLPTDLWEDEIIAVTHAVQPWKEVVVDSFRHDIHPPLYFLQLHFWSLFADSDVWFMANSILWSLLGCASLFWVVTKHFGRQVGLAATAAYAVNPSPVYMADQVRMYAMLATLVIWSLHFAMSVFKERDNRLSLYTALIVAQIAIILTHALGSIAVLCIGLYALQACKEAGGGYRKWLLCYGIAVLAAIPCAINAALHEGGVASSASLHGLMIVLGTSTLGIAAAINPIASFAGVVIFIVLIFIACRQTTTLQFLLFFTVVPLGLAFLGNAIQPFFKWNFFSTLQAPVIAIILGLVMSRDGAVAKTAVGFCLVVMLATSIETRMNFRESSRFLAVTRFLRENYRPGDVIFAPQPGYFHGVAWYLDGPRWGSPLKIAPPPSASWRKVYAKLGPNLVQRLELLPQTEIIDNWPFKLLTGTTPARDVSDAKRIWLVTADAADLPKGYPPPAIGNLRQQLVMGSHVQVSLYASHLQALSGSGQKF